MALEAAARLTNAGQWLEPERTRTARPEPGTPVELGERPPDIIDWIEGNYGPRVKVSSKADFGDYVSQARGAAATHALAGAR